MINKKLYEWHTAWFWWHSSCSLEFTTLKSLKTYISQKNFDHKTTTLFVNAGKHPVRDSGQHADDRGQGEVGSRASVPVGRCRSGKSRALRFSQAAHHAHVSIWNKKSSYNSLVLILSIFKVLVLKNKFEFLKFWKQKKHTFYSCWIKTLVCVQLFRFLLCTRLVVFL